MKKTFPLKRWHVLLAALFIFVYSMTGCSKNDQNKLIKNDSDTVLHRNKYDSAKFYVSFLLNIQKTSEVFNDTFSDDASMVIYVVNGQVRVPADSIRNFPPIVFPASGSNGVFNAVWVPDNIGEINITAASGFVIPGDTSVVMTLTHTGTVTPKWTISTASTSSTGGGVSTPGWPPGFTFSTKQQSQDAFKLDQPGSYFDIWVYKDY